jgi:twitching motility protein PilT
MAIDNYLNELWDAKGTDLLLTVGAPPLVRVDEEIRALDEPVLKSSDVERLVLGSLTETMAEQLKEHKEIDFSFNWQGKARFRGNAFYQRRSMAMALRLIPFAIPTFEELGLPPIVEKMVQQPSGLILVTGPTGAGKSTTQASMIDFINERASCHILTIEDPIEYLHQHKNSAVNQREVGEDTESFEKALRSALREDPDVLLVGEMRDLESIQTTLTIAETGHLVMATLHTNDTAQAIDRIIDVFPGDRRNQIQVQLASSLVGVIYQRLLPKIGGGLTAAYEVLVANGAVRNLIREGKSRQLRNVITTHHMEGMQTLEEALGKLVAEGVIDYEVAIGASLYPKEVEKPPPPPPELVEAAANGSGGRFRRK